MQNVANAAAVNVNVSVSRKMRCFVFRVCWSDVFNFSFYSKPKLWVFFRSFAISRSLSLFHGFCILCEWVSECVRAQTSFSLFRNMIFHSCNFFLLFFYSELVQHCTDPLRLDIYIWNIHRFTQHFLATFHFLLIYTLSFGASLSKI